MTDGATERAAFRRWAREHHPDVGGDPEVFAAGVQAFQEGRFSGFVDPEAAATALPAQERPPVYIQRTARGIAGVMLLAKRWRERRRRPPRVR